MENNKKIRVLVAAAPISLAAISETLESKFELDFVSSLPEATAYSYEKIDVIVCGLYFDESRMFDFLRYTQLHPKARTLPFFSVSAVEHGLTSTITQSIEIACRALGGAGFIDLYGWHDKYGVAHTRRRVEQLIRHAASLG